MVRIVTSLRESFEECGIQLHHYTPQDEIDKGMFVYSLIRRVIPKNFLKHYKRLSKIENNNKNNSNGNDEMMVMNQMIWSKLTRQIQEF
ncbi:hypothetical protein Glove_139g329 [Diversispora epigaea]|uniref:Uncharacterized protein n=1 Tax=Diversispora epigaea TaxID=1348612 RepID=A0A397IZP8_9GLOM|nr:hypothetical protein Glove_139g329 [Diversispora epigaea]